MEDAAAGGSSKAPQIKKRITPEASKHLTEFWSKVSKSPSPEQLAQLAAQICAMPNCEHYTTEKVKKWFQRRPKDNSELVSFLYPSFTPDVLDKLVALYKSDSEPTEKTVEIWAQILEERYGANPKDVNRWIALRQQRQQKTKKERESNREIRKQKKPNIVEEQPENADAGRSTQSLPQLPTPETTASPEPTGSKTQIKDMRMALALMIGDDTQQLPVSNAPSGFEQFGQFAAALLGPLQQFKDNITQNTRA